MADDRHLDRSPAAGHQPALRRLRQRRAPGEGVDYELASTACSTSRGDWRRDRVSGWRWLIGAFGIGTYRQDDSVDVRYERDGRSLVAQLPIESEEAAS